MESLATLVHQDFLNIIAKREKKIKNIMFSAYSVSHIEVLAKNSIFRLFKVQQRTLEFYIKSYIALNAAGLVEKQTVLMIVIVGMVVILLLLLHMLCDQIQRAYSLFLFFFRLRVYEPAKSYVNKRKRANFLHDAWVRA